MSRATDQFSMRLPISDARSACRDAIGGLGWEVESVETDRFDLVLGPRGNRNRQNISILIQPAGAEGTTIVLDGRIVGLGPLQKKHLSRSMSQIREAIANNASGIFLQDCKMLGGHGHDIAPGTACTLLFRSDEVQVAPVGGVQLTLRYEDVDALEIGGKGLIQSGGGFVGGGFGAEGALVGMGIASVLNSLSSSSHIDTVINLKGTDRQAWIHYPRETPQALNVRLSGVLAKIESTRRSHASATRAGASVSDELARVHELHSRGVLTDDEYAVAKARLIERL